MIDNPEAMRESALTYERLAKSYITGLIRTSAARIGQLSLEIALLKFRGRQIPPEASWPEEWRDVLKRIHSIAYHEYDAFSYVGDFGQLVFATTLVDTFLTDTTRFIFPLRPESIGKAQGITVSDIVSAKSTNDLLIAAVEKRAREVSYKSFLERLEFLEKQDGLPIALTEGTKGELEHFSGIRNVMIHDQAFYNLKLGPNGAVILDIRSCPLHPRPIDSGQFNAAMDAYMTVVVSVATAVFQHILKVEPPKLVLDSHPTKPAGLSSPAAPSAGPL